MRSAEVKTCKETSLYALLREREDEPHPGKPDLGVTEPFPVSRIKFRELYEGNGRDDNVKSWIVARTLASSHPKVGSWTTVVAKVESS